MFAPEQNTRGLALVITTARTSGCSKRMRCSASCKLDIHAQIVGIQLELVTRADAGVFLDIKTQRRDRAVIGKAPMPVARWVRLVIDEDAVDGFGHPLSIHIWPSSYTGPVAVDCAIER